MGREPGPGRAEDDAWLDVASAVPGLAPLASPARRRQPPAFPTSQRLRSMVHAPNRPPAGAPPTRINLYSDTQTRPTPA